MNLSNLIKYGTERLENAGIADASSDARIFAMHICKLSYTDMLMKKNDEIDSGTYESYKECVDRRCEHIPTQYIVGSTEFMGYEFEVMEGVLIPRPETELLVERAIELSKDIPRVKVLDMCCGSGCIGISYELLRRSQGKTGDVLHLADISDSAIELTDRNARKHDINCNIIKTDLFSNIDTTYDIIISNPPYIRTSDIDELEEEVRIHEPRLALDGFFDGLHFYREIIKDAVKRLTVNGIIAFEIGYDQYEDVSRLLEKSGFTDITLTKDYASLDRIVTACRK